MPLKKVKNSLQDKDTDDQVSSWLGDIFTTLPQQEMEALYFELTDLENNKKNGEVSS